MDEFDSPIVKEIPVYISQSLAKRLVVYQYPLEDCMSPDNGTVLQCIVKEDHEVVMDLERNVDSSNYSVSKGEQIAINVDGSKDNDDPMFPKKVMDKQMLVSKTIPSENVAVGIFQDGELHLTPAAGVALLRPSFRYLDKGDKRAKQESKEAGEEASEEEEELTQVTVKFARTESERAKKAREKSFSYISKQNAKQMWYRADYHDPTSQMSHLETQKLFCSRPGEEVGESRPCGDLLVESIMKNEDDERGRTAHGLPLTRLRSIPSLVERVKIIMLEAHVVQLGTLNRLLGGGESADTVQERIKVVQQVCVLVQGCWVVQSDVLIPKDSAPYGVPFTLLRCARDYMLYLLTRSRTVSRRKVMEVVKLPGDVIKALLEQVAKLNTNKEWQLKLDTDHHFIAQHPEVVGRQQAKWELRAEQFLAGLRPPEPGAPPSARNRRRSGRDSYSSDTDTEGKRSLPTPKPRRPKLSESRPD